MTIKIIANHTGSPTGKLADVELHFSDGPLSGLKLIGFSVWEHSGGQRHVVFPARTYSVHGERRSFALLRPIASGDGQEYVRHMILSAFGAFSRGESSCAAPGDAGFYTVVS
jgi:hypothetical protein